MNLSPVELEDGDYCEQSPYELMLPRVAPPRSLAGIRSLPPAAAAVSAQQRDTRHRLYHAALCRPNCFILMNGPVFHCGWPFLVGLRGCDGRTATAEGSCYLGVVSRDRVENQVQRRSKWGEQE